MKNLSHAKKEKVRNVPVNKLEKIQRKRTHEYSRRLTGFERPINEKFHQSSLQFYLSQLIPTQKTGEKSKRSQPKHENEREEAKRITEKQTFTLRSTQSERGSWAFSLLFCFLSEVCSLAFLLVSFLSLSSLFFSMLCLVFVLALAVMSDQKSHKLYTKFAFSFISRLGGPMPLQDYSKSLNILGSFETVGRSSLCAVKRCSCIIFFS